jgi:uncharacterized RDD family membrane protein YckC
LTVKTIGGGLRFVHLIADHFAIYIITFIIIFFTFFSEHSDLNDTIINLLFFILFPGYYTLMEYKFQQTAGKMITNSVVINEFAEKPSFRICLLRTLIRLVPFEGFSCLGTPSRGWHDRWTNTYVVPKDEVPKLKELIAKNNIAPSI